MARCVSLQHTPRLSAASALAFHDESILALLQDTSRDLFPPSVRGISACSWDNSKKIQLLLTGPHSSSVRQLNLRNEGTSDSLYFLGAALVPPLDPSIANFELFDDFGVCGEVSKIAPAVDEKGRLAYYESGVMQEKMTSLGKVACQIPPGTNYFVSASCKMISKPKAPSSKRHLLVLAFHDSEANPAQLENRNPDDCFHLFVGVFIDMTFGIDAAPVLSQLRNAALPFFPENLHKLFDMPPRRFFCATPSNDNGSLAGFYYRQHVPACVTAQIIPRVFVPEIPVLASDGYLPTATAGYLQELEAGVNEEEKAMWTGIRHFDMFHATMVAVAALPPAERRKFGMSDENVGSLFKLDVPGLHEGKPPVYRGDPVHIRIDGCEQTDELCCCAVVVHFSALVVQLPDSLPLPLKATNRVHVRFSIDFARLFAMRQAAMLLLTTPQWSFFSLQIPDPPHGGIVEWRTVDDLVPFPARAGRWFGALNEQQRYIVEAVHTMEKGSPPLLLVGPPGTGKSWAIAELVCQFMYCHVKRVGEALSQGLNHSRKPEANILLCAPTDVACDLLVDTIQRHLLPSSSGDTALPTGLMLRFNEPRRPLQQLFGRSAVLRYCCVDESTGSFKYPGHRAISEAVVTVCTLRAAWTLQYNMQGSGIAFDYIIVDEAGQALELEVCAALSLGNADARVLLAGDPKQLGPTCRAAQHGENDVETGELVRKLKISLLERLCEHHPRFASDSSPWLVRLYRNYRSHAAILELLSSTRYDGSLVAFADERLVRKFENIDVLPVKGFPLTFIGVRGEQRMDFSNENQHCLSRPDAAHSYHNPEEALVVKSLVSQLLVNQQDASEGAHAVTADDIGIVCSFRRQVQKIRGLLRAEGFGSVRVGTVEDYQGQQERILIISTTLTDPGQVTTLQQLDAETPPAASEAKPRKNKIHQKEQPPEKPSSRSKIVDALEACIRARARKDEGLVDSGMQMGNRQTENLVGSARRFTVALSRAQCVLIVVGCPEVLETSPHWRRFLLYVASRGALLGEVPSKSLLASAGIAAPRAQADDTEEDSMFAEAVGQDLLKELSSNGEKSTAELEDQVRRMQACAQESEALVARYAAEISSIGAELRISRTAKDEAAKRASVAEKRLQEEADDRLCVVCTVEIKAVALLPCGHVPVCRTCAPMLFAKGLPQCPNCRAPVESTVCLYL